MIIQILNPVWAKVDRQDIPKLKDFLSYPDYVYRTVYDPKQKRYRKKKQEFSKSFMGKDGVFPTGLIPRIKEQYPIEAILRPYEFIQKELVHPKGITLREDQIRIVNSCIKEGRGLIQSPTGSGKTVLAAALISSLKVPTIFLCHTLTLTNQTYKEFRKFGLNPTLFTGEEKEVSDLTIATIQSFSKIPECFDRFDMVIIDECFAKGTKILTEKNKKNIEDIKIGDKVITNKGINLVTNTFINKVSINNIIRVKFTDGNSVICSKDHLFLINNKWVKAVDLIKENSSLNIIFNMVSDTILKNIKKKNENENLSYLWERNYVWIKQILFKSMQIFKQRIKKNTFINNEKNKPRKERNNIRENEKKQPYVKKRSVGKNDDHKKNKWYFKCLERRKRWEWEAITDTTKIISNQFKLANRISNKDSSKRNRKREKKNSWLSNLLQIGYCKSNLKNRNRSRWRWSQNKKEQNNRQKERIEIKGIRVESVEIYKPGYNDKSFEGIISDKERNQGFVEFYDLEIQNTHHYCLENGIIVHNCHHLSSLDTVYGKVLQLLPAIYRFGFTATIPTELRHILTMESMLGNIIGSLSLEEGIEKGILAKPKVKIIKSNLDQNVKDLRKYQDVYQVGIIKNFSRNNIIIKEVKLLADQGKTSLILVNKIEHGQILERIGNRANLKIVFIQGKDDGATREELRSRLQNKEIDCVIATTIWKEGVNIPSLDCIINAAGGKSEIATLQSIGRGLRTTEDKKEVLLIDIFDQSHYYLIYHFSERFSLYLDSGFGFTNEK